MPHTTKIALCGPPAEGASEAVAGAPDEVKELVHYVSANRVGLGASAGAAAGSYFAIGGAGAATIGAFTSEFAIPAAIGLYGVWRAHEGYKAAEAYMGKNASQCDKY